MSLRDHRADERRADRIGDLVLRAFDDGREGEQELLVRQRMLAVAADDRRQQPGDAGPSSRAAACRGSSPSGRPRRRPAARRRSSRSCARPSRGWRRRRSARSGSSAGSACTVASFFASASAIASAFFGVQTPDALMHDRPPLAAMRAGDQVEVLLQFVGGVVAENHLAVARPVQLDARVVCPGLGGRCVAEEHRAIDGLEDRARRRRDRSDKTRTPPAASPRR